MIRRLLERITPSGRREARALRDRAARIVAAGQDAERRRRIDRIYHRFCA
jgi:hypothetical protein